MVPAITEVVMIGMRAATTRCWAAARRRRRWRWRAWRWAARTDRGAKMMIASIRSEISARPSCTVIMMTLAGFAAIEMVARTAAADRPTERRRTAGGRAALFARRWLMIVIAAVIPHGAVVAAMIPASMTAVMIAVMVVIVSTIMIMIMIMIVMMVVVTEKVETPGVEPDEAVARVEIVILGRTEPVDAGIAGPVAIPLVAPPIAADPVVIVAVYVAIVERSLVPFAVEINRTISDRVIPKIGRAAVAVAIAAGLVGKSYAAARSVA